MSAELASVQPARGLLADPRHRRVLRYALGSTLAMAVALGVGWDLSFLTPVLSLSLLAAPGPTISFKKGLAFVTTIAVACYVGLWVCRTLLNISVIFFALIGLLLLWLFYARTGKLSPFLTTWLLIALLVLPMLAVQSPDLALLVALGIVTGASVTLLVVWVAHALIPEPVPAETGSVAAAPPPVKPPASPAQRFREAATTTCVVMPVLLVFHLFEWTGGILILVFVALLSLQPGFARDFRAGKALILGNTMGGLAAMLMYWLLTIVPQFVFMLLLTLLFGLFFGSRLMSNNPRAALYGMAYSTLLLIIGQTTTSTGSDAASKVYVRILQIMVAVVYVVTAFGLITRYRRAKGG